MLSFYNIFWNKRERNLQVTYKFLIYQNLLDSLPGIFIPWAEIGVLGDIWLLLVDAVGEAVANVTLFFLRSVSLVIWVYAGGGSVDSPFVKCKDFGRSSDKFVSSCPLWKELIAVFEVPSSLFLEKSSSINLYSHASFPLYQTN
jgi:hypothetical protein